MDTHTHTQTHRHTQTHLWFSARRSLGRRLRCSRNRRGYGRNRRRRHHLLVRTRGRGVKLLVLRDAVLLAEGVPGAGGLSDELRYMLPPCANDGHRDIVHSCGRRFRHACHVSYHVMRRARVLFLLRHRVRVKSDIFTHTSFSFLPPILPPFLPSHEIQFAINTPYLTSVLAGRINLPRYLDTCKPPCGRLRFCNHKR